MQIKLDTHVTIPQGGTTPETGGAGGVSATDPVKTPSGLLATQAGNTDLPEATGDDHAKGSVPDLAKPGGGTTDAGILSGKFGGPIKGGFNISQLFAELLDVGKTLRTAARIDREAKVAAVESEAKAAAQDIRSAAICSLTSSLVSSVGQIAGGAMSLRGTLKAQATFDTKYKETFEMLSATGPGGTPGATKVQATMGAMDIAKQAIAKQSAMSNFSATLTSEGAKALATVPQIVGQYVFEASKAEHQAASARQQAGADNESDSKQAAEKLVSTVLEKLTAIQQAQSQMMGSIARMG